MLFIYFTTERLLIQIFISPPFGIPKDVAMIIFENQPPYSGHEILMMHLLRRVIRAILSIKKYLRLPFVVLISYSIIGYRS